MLLSLVTKIQRTKLNHAANEIERKEQDDPRFNYNRTEGSRVKKFLGRVEKQSSQNSLATKQS